MLRGIILFEKTKLLCLTAGALIGIGGAYAAGSKVGSANITYNWYTSGGTLAFISTIAVAKSICPESAGIICLQGTRANLGLQAVTVFRSTLVP